MAMLRKCPYRQIFITGDRHEGFRYNYQCSGRHIRRRPWHAFEGRAEGTFSADTHAGPWGMHHFYWHIRSVEGHAPRGERHTGNYGHHASHRVPTALPVGLWQGGITIFAGFLEPVLTPQIVSDLSFTGNVLIFCVGVNLAFGKKFRVGNMLPALLFAAVFDAVAGIFKIYLYFL